MIKQIVDFLNEALKQDEDAINRVFLNIMIPSSDVMIQHPTVQVRQDGMLRLIGLLNGLAIDGNKCIRIVYNESRTKIMRFEIGKVY